MARMQRWKRSRSAGEGTGPDAEADETAAEQVDEVDGEVGLLDDTGAPVDAAPVDAAPVDADPVDADPVETVLDEELAADLDPDTDPDTEPDTELDTELRDGDLAADGDALEDELDELPETDRPLLPSATDPRFGGGLFVIHLLQAAHAKQAITTALAMALAAAISGRPARETAVVLLTVLVGQTILGWHNDIVDRQRDQAHGLTGKPVAMGRITTETLWYALFVAALLLVPLAITTGIKAGCLYLASVAVGLLGNVVLRTGFFSWWSWAVSYALLPAYLSYGGWGGQAEGNPPEPVILVLAALLGIGVHFMRAVWGLVADHEDGWTYLPLKLGLRLGATRLLALSTVYTAIIAILIAVMGAKVGLSK